MAKRFTDTDKWKRSWFTDLDPKAKLVWFYILDMCDHRGVWFENFKLMSLQLGFKVEKKKFESWFGDKIKPFDGDKYFIKSFVDFQYAELNPNNNAHKAVIALVDSIHNLAPNEDLTSPSQGAQDKDKDTDKVNVLGECEGGSVGPINPRVLVEIWESDCGPFSKIESFTDARKIKAKAQLEKYPDFGHWRAVLARWKSSEFCKTQWKPTFDDWLSETKRTNTLEGRYDNRESSKPGHRQITHKRAEEVLAEQETFEPAEVVGEGSEPVLTAEERERRRLFLTNLKNQNKMPTGA